MKRLVLILGLALLSAGALAAPNPIYKHGFENHPDAVEVLTFVASPATIYPGASTTLSWVLKDATSCTPTQGTAQWRDLVINGSNNSFDVTTLTTAGNYSFTLTCVGPVGDPSVASTNVVVEVPPPVAILTFLATPSTIKVNEKVTLSWTLENAVNCTTSGGTTQWRALVLNGSNGNREITDLNSAGEYQFGLSCVGLGGDTDNDSRQVTVEPASSCPAPTLTVGQQNFQWADFWQSGPGVFFPEVSTSRIDQTVYSKGYFSIEFNTGNFLGWAQFASVNNTLSSGVRLGAISKCKGRFDVPSLCRRTWGTGTGLRWTTEDKANSCVLELNTTYFLNFTFTDGVDPNSNTCVIGNGSGQSAQCIITVDYQKP